MLFLLFVTPGALLEFLHWLKELGCRSCGDDKCKIVIDTLTVLINLPLLTFLFLSALMSEGLVAMLWKSRKHSMLRYIGD